MKHRLSKIAEQNYDTALNLDLAIYWCKDCGAIQMDIESDGRFIRHHKVLYPTQKKDKEVGG